MLTEAALNFLQNQEEVTMIAGPTSFMMKNYVDVYDAYEEKAAVHTELTMQPGAVKGPRVNI